jgi:hypothetical protein
MQSFGTKTLKVVRSCNSLVYIKTLEVVRSCNLVWKMRRNCECVLHYYVRNFFIEPPQEIQRIERQGERGIWVAMSCYLLHANPLLPPSSLPSPHRASVAPPAATLSGLAEGRPLPPLPPLPHPGTPHCWKLAISGDLG